MKKNSLILVLTLVLTFTATTFASEPRDGETHGTGIAGMICQVIDCLFYGSEHSV